MKILPVHKVIPKHFPSEKGNGFPKDLIFSLYDFLRLNVGKFDSLFIIQMLISSPFVSEESVKLDIGMYICQQHCSRIVHTFSSLHE